MDFLRKILKMREISLLIIVLVFIIILTIYNPFFATRANVFGVLYSITVNAMIAGAMTILFVSGGFDLSVGSTLALCGMIVMMLIKLGVPIPIAILLTISTGVILGMSMGSIVSYLDINPFIVTLAGFFIIRSMHLIFTGGSSIGGARDPFTLIASFKIFKVPIIIIFAVLSLVIFDILLRKNKFFRQNYFIGGNANAAELMGINIKKIKLFNYALVGGMAAVAGILSVSRFNNSNIEGSPNSAFQIITAVILGGASLKGGKGTITGTALGLILMALIHNALVLFGLDIIWNKVAIGTVLITVIIFDSLFNKESDIVK